ncbi:MAG: MFS transporter [Candidatus Anstonellaceae archaeon]
MVRKIFWLNFLDAFIGGVVIIAVPLAMLHLQIDIKHIGIVFALSPLASFFVRLAAAALADRIGERLFYILNAASNAAQSALYLFFPTPAGFAAGKLFDGARTSLIWAVNRTSIISHSTHNRHFTLGSMVGGRQVFFALGCFSVAIFAPIWGFEALFLLCLLISLGMLYLAFGVKSSIQGQKADWAELLSSRSSLFYETAAVMALGSTFYMVMLYILFPVFFAQRGFSSFDIGILYAAYALVFGIGLRYISSKGWESKKAAIAGAFGFAVPLAGIVLYPELSAGLFVLMALGDASLALIWEETIYLQAKHSKKKSTDIALLHAPGMIAVFAASAATGFALEAFGFATIILVSAVSLVIYALLSLRLIAKQTGGASGLQI